MNRLIVARFSDWQNRPSSGRLAGKVALVTGQAIAVDGGYTAGRDHGVTKLMGLS